MTRKNIILSISSVLASFVMNLHAEGLSFEPKASDVEMKYIQTESQRKRELRQLEYSDAVELAKVNKPDTFALVSLREGNICLLDAKEYNLRIENIYSSGWKSYLTFFSDSQPDINHDTVVSRVLYSIIQDAYIIQKWRIEKTRRAFADSVRTETEKAIRKLSSELPDSLLRIRYRQYFNELFSEKNNSLYALLSSTDTLLLSKMLALVHDTLTTGRMKGKELVKNGYIVSCMPYDSMTEEMKKNADSVEVGRWSRIFKAPWGFYAIGMYRENFRKEVSYDDAIGQLVYLPELEERSVGITDENARLFYEDNPELFDGEDTMELSVSVMPWVAKRTADNKYEPVLPSNENVPAFACFDYQLPHDMRASISFSEDSCTGRMDFYNAKWNICLSGVRKGKPLSFEQCRESIKKHLLSQWKAAMLSNGTSVAQRKEDERSYLLFVRQYIQLHDTVKKAAFERDVKKWAKENVSSYWNIAGW